MNRANVHRPVARDLGADPRDERLVLADRVEVRGRVAPEARRHVHRAARVAPTTSRSPGPTSVWPPSRIGIGRRGGGRASASRSHGSAIRVGEQQVRREAVLGGRPARLVRARAGGRAGPACRRSRRRRSAARWSPERARPVAVEQRARARDAGRPLARPAPRAEGRAPRQRARARRRRALEPGERRRRTSGRRRGARPRGSRGHGADGRRAAVRDGARGRRRSRPPTAAEQDEVERAVEVDRQPPAAAQVGRPRSRRPPPSQRGSALSAGRSGTSPRTSSSARRSRRRRPSSGCWRGRPGRRRRPPRRTRAGRAAVASGIAPEPRTTSPAGRSARTSVAQPRPNERRVGRPAHDRDVVGARRRRNPRRWRSASRGTRVREPAAERPGAGPGFGVQDADA